jgi:hypothetical protein
MVVRSRTIDHSGEDPTMNGKGFGPAHDRIDLTEEEMRTIGRLEDALDTTSVTPTGAKRQLRSPLTPRARAYYLCMRFRRSAIWLIPVAGVGLAVAVTISVALATAFAAVWTIGFAALLTEIAAKFRWMQSRRAGGSWANADPNAADGGR